MSTESKESLNMLLPLSVESIYDDAFPHDVFIRIGGYWTGKEFSSYLLAAEASRHLRSHHLAHVSRGICKSLTARCSDFLASLDDDGDDDSDDDTPDAILQTWREQSEAALRSLDTSRLLAKYMKSVSDWCAFLDYCEQTPLRLSKATLQQDDPPHALWIIGTGSFGGSLLCETVSPAMLSVPTSTWKPELLFLAEKWLVDFVQRQPALSHGFPMAIEQFEQNIDSSAAILSWKDPKYLEFIHKRVDIDAGMLVYQQYGERGAVDDAHFVEGSYLNWFPRAWCEMYPTVRQSLGGSERLKWMIKETAYDKNMLTSFEINQTTIPPDHMEGFGQRVVKLMKQVETWY